MLNKALVCIVMLAVIFGCANEQKDTAEEPAEQTQKTEATEQAEQPEATEQAQETGVAVEEISLTVTGMMWGNCVTAVQDALSKVTGVTEVVSVSHADSKAVVKVKKDEVKTEDLVQAVEADPRFTAQVIE